MSNTSLSFLQMLIIAIVPTLGVQIILHLLGMGPRRSSDAKQIRDELWKELGSLREMVESQGTELSEWKTKYFVLLGESVEYKQRFTAMILRYNTVIRLLEVLRTNLQARGLHNLVPVLPELEEEEAHHGTADLERHIDFLKQQH